MITKRYSMAGADYYMHEYNLEKAVNSYVRYDTLNADMLSTSFFALYLKPVFGLKLVS